MRRNVLSLVVAAAWFAVAVVAAHGQAPTLTVTPTAGNQFQSFTFAGSGFLPGATLTASFISPDGEEFAYYVGLEPGVITAGLDGGFSVTVMPAVDFAGGRAGPWRASFCSTTSLECWRTEFAVSQ